MGGRGGKSGFPKSQPMGSVDGCFPSPQLTDIETVYLRRSLSGNKYASNTYKDEVLEASTDGAGNLTFSYASNGAFAPTAKTNVRVNVTFSLLAGAVNGTTFNIDWNKVQSISGLTYNLRQEAKANGLKWNPTKKIWSR